MSVNTLLLYFFVILTLPLPFTVKPNQLTSEATIEILKNLESTLQPPFLVISNETVEFKTKIQKALAQTNIFAYFEDKMNKDLLKKMTTVILYDKLKPQDIIDFEIICSETFNNKSTLNKIALGTVYILGQ